MYGMLANLIMGQAAGNQGSAGSTGKGEKRNYFDQLMAALNQPTYSQRAMKATNVGNSDDSVGNVMNLMQMLKGTQEPSMQNLSTGTPISFDWEGGNKKPWEDYDPDNLDLYYHKNYSYLD